MKLLVASDSFKGTLSSKQICELFYSYFASHQIKHDLVCLPIADGGEGSLECLSFANIGRKIDIEVQNSDFKPIKTFYLLNNDLAYIETASCCGLAKTSIKNPSLTTTYGLGEEIKSAISNGAKKIYLFLGGSSTNDGGCGLLAALGCHFYNSDEKEFIPTGGTLNQIYRIDTSSLNKNIKGIEFIGLSDVNNPLYGKEGAAYVFAKQKGANEQMVDLLDKGLIHLNNITKQCLNIDISNVKGAGAAGGLGFCILAFLKGKIVSGSSFLLDTFHFNEILQNSDFVITGEGQFDNSSFRGKLVDEISLRAVNKHIPIILIVGKSLISFSTIKERYSELRKIIEIGKNEINEFKMKENAKENYLSSIEELLSFIDKGF